MKKQIIIAFALTAALGAVNPAVPAEAKWKTDSYGRWYTIKDAPGYAVGWKKIGKSTYYFDKSKYAAKGWRLIDKKWYFFDAQGKLVTNAWIDGYYVTEDGSMAVNATITTLLGVYTFDANGNVVSNPASPTPTPGVTKHSNCWVQRNGKYYYYDYQGNLAKGWLKIKDKTYYMNPITEERYTGWLKSSKKYYYFQSDSGLMAQGWLKINKKTYHFKEDGSAVSGWKKINGNFYYFSKKGKMYTNKLIKKKYYVNASGQRVFGFQDIKDATYYFSRQTGKMVKGWASIDKKKYYFDSAGKMVKNRWVGNSYLKENGQMAKKAWVGKYYINKNGVRSNKTRSTGFWKHKKKTYFLDQNYEKVISQWVTSGGKYYYMGADGVLSVSQWIGNYYVGADGARIINQMLKIGEKTYLFKKDGTKATGIVNHNKKTYLFDRNGAMVTGWYNNSVATFYFLPSTGEMIKNKTVIIDNVYYYFDANGYMLNEDTLNSNLALGAKIAAYAQQFIGNPYVSGGTSLTKGADCSGFTQTVMKHFGIAIPRTADQQARGSDGTNQKYAAAKVISVKNIKPGDLVFYYSPISHVGIYIGDGKIVHASNSAAYPQGGIKISPYNYATIRAIIRYW